MRNCLYILVFLLDAGLAHAIDEPGIDDSFFDEPGMVISKSETGSATEPEPDLYRVRLELGFGYASLLADPLVGEGFGGALHLGVRIHSRVEIEAAVFAGANSYEGLISAAAPYFLAANVSLGTSVHLLPLSSRFFLTLDVGSGAYMVFSPLDGVVWNWVIHGGLSLGFRFTSWMGVGVKCRYHLFNLAGPGFRDLNSLTLVGVIDRLEMPAYLAFYF
ncbi:MAG: hypothetical protein V1754_11835 [Pseudomonadota bacterium]